MMASICLAFSLIDLHNVSTQFLPWICCVASRSLSWEQENLFMPCFAFIVYLVFACSIWKWPERSLSTSSSKCYQVDDWVGGSYHACCTSMRTWVWQALAPPWRRASTDTPTGRPDLDNPSLWLCRVVLGASSWQLKLGFPYACSKSELIKATSTWGIFILFLSALPAWLS